MAKYIFHIADIHIHERNYAHIRHSWALLMKDIIMTPEYNTSVILVIAGDLFDHKTYLTAGDVSLFYDMMSDLETQKINTIMMPGNHDYNINNYKDDKINALVDRMSYKFIRYSSLSAILEISGILFFVHSPIDQLVLRPSLHHRGKRTVALVHEPLSESRTCSGITFGHKRFAASDFTNIFNMTMMGDIHMPQLLAPNVAYSGSFVQKNRGEDIHHGYMKWEVATGKPTFVEMVQLSLHIKIWARNNKMDDIPGVTARSVSLYYSNCDDSNIDIFKKKLESVYSRKVDVFNKTVIQIPGEVATIQNVKELGPTIISNIISMNLNDAQNNRIFDIHRSMFSESKHESGLDWRIRFLSWSNMYCYGENNYINFDDIGNLTSMIGANKVGKSSIIDIIMLVLYNQTSRGSKRNALNVNSTEGYIKCIITVGSDEYAIERAWVDKNTVAVRLYKNGENVTNEDIVSTYKIIGKIVGSKRVFINSTAALQQRQFIVDLGSKEIYELVCRMMDLDKLREIEDQNSIDARQLKKQIASIQPKLSGMDYKELLKKAKESLSTMKLSDNALKLSISYIQTRISLISVDLVDNCENIKVLSNKLSLLDKYKKWDSEQILSKLNEENVTDELSLADIERDIIRLTNQNNELKLELRPVLNDVDLSVVIDQIKEAELIDIDKCTQKVSTISSSLMLTNDQIKRKESLIQEIKLDLKLKKSIIEPDARLISIIEDDINSIGDIHDKAPHEKKLEDCRTDLSLLDAQLEIARNNRNSKIKSGQDQKAILRSRLDDLTVLLDNKTKETDLLNKKLFSKKMDISKISAIENLQTLMEWNYDCQCCSKNANIFNTSIMDTDDVTETKIAKDAELEIDGYKKEIAFISSSLEDLAFSLHYVDDEKINAILVEQEKIRSDIIILVDTIQEISLNKKKIKKLLAEASASKSNEAALEKVIELAKKIEEEEMSLSKLKQECENLKNDLDKAHAPINLLKKTASYKSQYNDYIHNNSIKNKINEFNNDITIMTNKVYYLRERRSDRNVRIKNLGGYKTLHLQYVETKDKLDAAIINENILDEIKELEDESAVLKKKLEDVNYRIEYVSVEIGKYEQLLKSDDEYKKEIDLLEQSYSDRIIYDKVINHKTGVPEHMMKAMCANIQLRCNDILRSAADFEIDISYDKEITINTKIDDKIISAEQASGYQKFIMDLILRQVLCSLTLSSHPRILFVDEGFGALDKDNFANVCNVVLPALAKHFEKVIIISHIQGIHDYTVDDCVITTINGRSHIQYGKIAFDGTVLRVIKDHEQHVRDIKEQKEAAKIINDAEKIRKNKDTRVSKDTEEKILNEYAISKQEEYGDSIIESIDENTVRCMACDKIYKKRNGFARSHILSTGHMKCMRVFK
jgi:hypothetical protein